MKKIFATLLAVALLFSLVACGAAKSTANNSASNTDAAGATAEKFTRAD